MDSENRSSQFGDWIVQWVECGGLSLDGGAMFGSVPRVLWERWVTPDSAHRIPLSMRILLIRHSSGSPCVLVDAGIGDKYDDDFREMFNIQTAEGAVGGRTSLEAALSASGVALPDVTHLIITHLHFDHAGGIAVGSPADGAGGAPGSVQPALPGVEHILQRANLETARSPNPRERASYLTENVGILDEVPLTLLDGEEEVLPGIRVFPSHGHTRGMQGVRVEGGGRVLYYVSDLAPTHHHLRVPFTMGYDLSPREIMEEKQRLWPRVIAEDAVIVFEHDPWVPAATLQEVNGKFKARTAVELTAP